MRKRKSKKLTIRAREDIQSINDWPYLDAVIEELTKARNKIAALGGTNSRIEHETKYDYYDEQEEILFITYDVEETDKQFEARLAKEEKDKLEMEAREKKQLEALKKKYGNV
jgi:hypothetical protein